MKRERLRRLVHPHIIGKFSVDLLGYSLRPNLIEASSSLGIKSREAWRIWIKVLPLSKTRSWPWSSQKTYLKVSNRQTSSNIVTMNILTTGRLACVYSPWIHQKTGLGFLIFSGGIDVCVRSSLCGFFQAIPDSKNFKFACSFEGFHLRIIINLLKCIFYNLNCTDVLPFWNMFYIDWLVFVNAKILLFQFVISNNIFKKCIKKLMFGIRRWLLEVNLF